MTERKFPPGSTIENIYALRCTAQKAIHRGKPMAKYLCTVLRSGVDVTHHEIGTIGRITVDPPIKMGIDFRNSGLGTGKPNIIIEMKGKCDVESMSGNSAGLVKLKCYE